jgi:lysozyme family protein
MTDLKKLAAAEAHRWASMHIDPKRRPEFDAVAKRLVAPAAKARYITVSARTGVPWWVISVISERECGQRWDRNIAQGDPWCRKSTHVPKGRGPFKSWEDAAFDALVDCAPKAAHWTDWSIGGTLTILEMYNGLGYAAKGVASPYDWSGTDQYRSGKYVADHQYDPAAVDRQLGCAALLACMAVIDPDIHFDYVTAPKPDKPHDQPPPQAKPLPPQAPRKTVVAGTAAATAAGMSGTQIGLIAAVVILIAVAGVIVWHVLRDKKHGQDQILPTQSVAPSHA